MPGHAALGGLISAVFAAASRLFSAWHRNILSNLVASAHSLLIKVAYLAHLAVEVVVVELVVAEHLRVGAPQPHQPTTRAHANARTVARSSSGSERHAL